MANAKMGDGKMYIKNEKMKKAKPAAPAKATPSKSMTAAAPRSKKSAEKMAAEKASRKILVPKFQKEAGKNFSNAEYNALRKAVDIMSNRMVTERGRSATRAKAAEKKIAKQTGRKILSGE